MKRNFFESNEYNVSVMLITIVSSMFYVASTYWDNYFSGSLWLLYAAVELFFFSVFLIDYIVSIIFSINQFEYISSFTGFSDSLALLPTFMLLISKKTKYSLNFLRFPKLLKIFRIKNFRGCWIDDEFASSNVANQIWQVGFQVMRLIITISIFIFFVTGVVYLISALDSTSFSAKLGWLDCLYFIVVTITTVGYGDIYPTKSYSRIVIICIISIGFVIIPVQAAIFAQVVFYRKKHFGRLTNTKSHICLCGLVDYELIHRFMWEIMNIPGNNHHIPTVVILSPVKPSPSMFLLLQSSPIRDSLYYFVGSSKSFADLSRIRAEFAISIYILPDMITSSLRIQEDSIYMSAIAVSRYLKDTSRSIRPFSVAKLTSSARNKPILGFCGVNATIAVQELKYSILALGAIYPGFLSFFRQLTVTPYEKEIKKEASRYFIHEIKTTFPNFSQRVLNLNFQNAVLAIYRMSLFKIVLVGIIFENRVIINPSGLESLSYRPIGTFSSLLFFSPDIESIIATIRNCDELIIEKALRSCTFEKFSYPILSGQSNAVSADRKVSLQSPSDIKRLISFASSVAQRFPSFVSNDKEDNGCMTNESLLQEDFDDHIIVVVSAGEQSDNTPIAALMLPIFHFIKTVRLESSCVIIILNDRGEELFEVSREIQEHSPNVMKNVRFFVGFGRNLHHLKQCQISKAKAVVIIRPQISCEATVGDDASKSALMNNDRFVIMTYLNIQLLSNDLSQRSAGDTSINFLCEMAHEFNERFLSPSSTVICSKSDEDNIASSSILFHAVLDALAAQVIYCPHIVMFWESVLRLSGDDFNEGKNYISKENTYEISLEPRANLNRNASRSFCEEELRNAVEKIRQAQEEVKSFVTNEANDNLEFNHPRYRQIFGTIKTDSSHWGQRFDGIFENYLLKHGIICVGLCRHGSQLSHETIVVPSPDTLLWQSDEIFVFHSQISKLSKDAYT